MTVGREGEKGRNGKRGGGGSEAKRGVCIFTY